MALAAAKKIAASHHWDLYGYDQRAAWGIVRGSKPYQVKIDLVRQGFGCQCPSRQIPCKHVLALLLRYAGPQQLSLLEGDKAVAEAPDWVTTWIARRDSRVAGSDGQEQKADPQETISEPPAADVIDRSETDPAGQLVRTQRTPSKPARSQPVRSKPAADSTRRRKLRHQRIEAGLARLEHWMADQVRQGIVHLETRGHDQIATQRRRLIDAQAPAVASAVEAVGAVVHSGAGWQQRTALALGRLMLLARGYRRYGFADDAMGWELRQSVGWNVPPALLREQPLITDVWAVIAQHAETFEKLHSQRTWLVGRTTGRTAMVLQYAFGGQNFAADLQPGTDIPAALQFYPGCGMQRGRIHKIDDGVGPILGRPPGHAHWEEMLDAYAAQLARSPWQHLYGGIMHDCRLVTDGGQWMLMDSRRQCFPVQQPLCWKLIAASGGQVCDVGFEWDGQRPHVHGIWHRGAWYHKPVEPSAKTK
jgi:hypothetical protein